MKMVDSADFMASGPDGQVDMLGGGEFMAPEAAVMGRGDAPAVGGVGAVLRSPVESLVTARRQVGELRLVAPEPSASADEVPVMASPSPAGSVPVATRIATSESISPPETKSRRNRRRKAQAEVVVRRPEEWVLDPGEFTQIPDRAYQELWFELRTWTWKSLAIVPTISGGSELDVAEKLVVVGVSNSNRRMSLISAEGASIADTDRVIAMIRAAEARGDRVIVCTDSIQDNPSAAPIIRAVNGAVLSVRLGQSEKATIERTISTIHRNRIIGVITRRSK